MAYLTGAVLGVDALMSALVDFAVNQAGWTLHDVVSANDKVISSAGEDGKLAMVFRVSSSLNASANPFYNTLANLHRAANHVLVQGYHNWDPSTHTGTNNYGDAGPFWVSPPSADNSPLTSWVKTSTVNPPYNNDGRSPYTPTLPGSLSQYDGTRLLMGATGTGQLRMADLVSGSSYTSGTTAGLAQIHGNGAEAVYDDTTDNWDMYVFSATTTQIDQFWKYSFADEGWKRLPSPNYTSTPANTVLLADGAGNLFAFFNNTAKRYNIATATWATLAAPPVSRNTASSSSAGYSLPSAVYLPSAVSGFTEDVIYTYLANTSTVYRYNVTSNTWGPNFTAPRTYTNGMHLTWDERKCMIIADLTTTAAPLYVSDVTVDPTAFSVGATFSAVTESKSFLPINGIPAKLRANHSANTRFWFVGDKDAIVAVCELRGHYYWMSFGRYDQYNNTSVAVLVAPAPAGLLTEIEVDSTAGFSVGDRVTLFDSSTGASEQTTIYSVDSGTVFRANLRKSYTVGTRAGTDPAPYCNAGNGLAVTPIGPKGYGADLMNTTYAVLPSVSVEQSIRNGPNPRGAYHLYPMKLVQENTGMTNCEDLGTLKNIFGVRAGGGNTPLRAEDLMYFNGKPYMVFPEYNTARLSDNRWVVLGPLE